MIVQSIGTMVFRLIKSQKVLLATIILWLLIANSIYVPCKAMWINESFYAFPFFALGYCIGKERYMKIETILSHKSNWLYSSLAVIGLLLVWFLSTRNDMMSSSYPHGYGAFYIVALICILCLFTLSVKIKEGRILSVLTWLGVNSLTIDNNVSSRTFKANNNCRFLKTHWNGNRSRERIYILEYIDVMFDCCNYSSYMFDY